MGTQDENVETLSYESFVAFAQRRVGELAPDIDIDAMSFVLTLHRAESTLIYDLESTVHRPAGWTWAGFRLLFVLWLVGRPLEARHAARLSGNSRQATSTLADTLQRDGLISRLASPHDGRLVMFALTPGGEKALSTRYAEHNRREQLWASVLEPEERAAVTAALAKILAAVPQMDVRRRNQ